MDFSEALLFVKNGAKIQRAGWNGKGMWVKKFTPGYIDENQMAEAMGLTYAELPTMLQYLAMRTADNALIPWLASQSDILAEDWQVVE